MYTVQINAAVQTNPPRITLTWAPDPYGATNYTVFRKARDATSWGAGTVLSGSASGFVDSNVSIGTNYEYKVLKITTNYTGYGYGYKGYGYLYSGISVPMIENRGKLVLVVASNCAPTLSSELARLQSDLTGDGWLVLRHDVGTNDTPAAVKALITGDYYADPTNVKAVFLFGHVPVLQSGNINYDGHQYRPMPADAYYGDMDGNWSGSPDFIPSDIELMVGRVDLWNMPGAGAPVAWPSEFELLRNYLNKDHNWRHNLLNVQRRALMGNRRGDEMGEGTAASGYRNFDPLIGLGNTVEANIADTAPANQRWISMLGAGSYLWAYGCGGGAPVSISALGTNGQYFDVWSTDIVRQDAKAVFVMLFGSWFGNWDDTDDIMRSILATPSMGLAACMAGRPHWFFHHMGLGEPIGFSTRLTMNNSTLYQNETNNFTRAVYIALMGDPTLRLDPITRPGSLSASALNGSVTLAWTGSPDATAGYHVFRATNAGGPFTRLTTSAVTGTNFSEAGLSAGNYYYMVRAVKMQTTPSGSYFNPSQGIFASVVVTNGPLLLSAVRTGNTILLSWNSESGHSYRVLAATNVTASAWSNVSGSILASGPTASWNETNHTTPARFYRIVSP